jgi:branched-chain amino acid transport system ATP-binding protein
MESATMSAFVSEAPLHSLLEARGISKSFGGIQAVDNINVAMEPGELRCLIGPNGAGKSTFLQILAGNIQPDRGTVHFVGRDITRRQPHQRAHMGIAIKYQNVGVYQNLTVRHNLLVPLRHRFSGEPLRRETERWLAQLDLSGTEGEIARKLSHGQKQWLALGMTLAMRPQVLLLDEPTAGMTREETRATGELIRGVNANGVAALIVEHDMAFVRQLNAPITVMHYGRVLAEGTLAEIERHEEVQRIYLGTNGQSATGTDKVTFESEERRRRR